LEKFLEVASKEFKDPYFVQTGGNEEGYFEFIIRIRDKRTTGITAKDKEKSCINGVFIEIYPFDGYCESKFKKKIQMVLGDVLKYLLRDKYYYNDKDKLSKKILHILSPVIFCFIRYEKMWRIWQNICALYSNTKTNFVDQLTVYEKSKEYHWYYTDVKDTILVNFEYTTAAIPIGYDRCLKKEFCNYMELPPIEKRGVHHNTEVFYDPYLPYTEYVNSCTVKNFFSNKEDNCF